MPRKFNIDDVRKEALNKYGLLLLTKEYINSNKPMLWKDIDTGTEFKRSWHSIKRGQTSVGNPSKKLTITDIAAIALERYELTLVSTTYINSKDPLLWKDNKTGIQFYRSWNNLSRGHTAIGNPCKIKSIEDISKQAHDRWGYKLISVTYSNSGTPLLWEDETTGKIFTRSWNNLNNGIIGTSNRMGYPEIKKYIDNFENLGYTLDMTEEEFNNSNKEGDRVYHILTPEGATWNIKHLSQFKRSARSRVTKGYMSTGECLVSEALNHSGIRYEREVRVIIGDKVHRLDFLLPEYNVIIEYDGRQHYDPVPLFGGVSGYNNRVTRDNMKDTWAASKGYTMIRVPFTSDTLLAVQEKLAKYLPIVQNKNVEHDKGSHPIIKNKIVGYYKKHSLKDTCTRFNLAKCTVIAYFKQVQGCTRLEYQRKEIAEYLLTHTIQETMDKFPEKTKDTILRCVSINCDRGLLKK